MKQYERCPACNGSRKIMGGGMIMRDCHACDGTGNVEVKRDEENTETVIVVKKRMGRPPKKRE